jgi:cell fate regulator YaaT (PSP1 superfamily)
MLSVKLKLYPWEKPLYADPMSISLKKGDLVLFRHDSGVELGEVAGFEDIDIEKQDKEQGGLREVLRLAEETDHKRRLTEPKKGEILSKAREIATRLNLEMKIVDAYSSYDGSRLTLAFIADGRVDFRELVKELQRHLNQAIRLQQIGIRDEAKLNGDCGHCGRPLCCRGLLSDFISITSEMAEAQQCEHRGSERISGICGRLMCCLAYEEKGYKELANGMPTIGTQVNVDGRKGEVISRQILKRAVNVKFADKEARNGYTIQEVDLDRKKKAEKK